MGRHGDPSFRFWTNEGEIDGVNNVSYVSNLKNLLALKAAGVKENLKALEEAAVKAKESKKKKKKKIVEEEKAGGGKSKPKKKKSSRKAVGGDKGTDS